MLTASSNLTSIAWTSASNSGMSGLGLSSAFMILGWNSSSRSRYISLLRVLTYTSIPFHPESGVERGFGPRNISLLKRGDCIHKSGPNCLDAGNLETFLIRGCPVTQIAEDG